MFWLWLCGSLAPLQCPIVSNRWVLTQSDSDLTISFSLPHCSPASFICWQNSNWPSAKRIVPNNPRNVDFKPKDAGASPSTPPRLGISAKFSTDSFNILFLSIQLETWRKDSFLFNFKFWNRVVKLLKYIRHGSFNSSVSLFIKSNSVDWCLRDCLSHDW